MSLFIAHLGKYEAEKNVKTKMKIPQETSIYMRYLHQHGRMKIYPIFSNNIHSLQNKVLV